MPVCPKCGNAHLEQSSTMKGYMRCRVGHHFLLIEVPDTSTTRKIVFLDRLKTVLEKITEIFVSLSFS